MRLMVFKCSLPATALFLTTLPIAAHHSAAMFDLGRDITLEGVVTHYEWASPHVYIHVEVGSKEGGGTVWMIEASAPNLMARLGWSPGTLALDERVRVAAHPSRKPSSTMALAASVVKQDGTSLLIRRPPGQSSISRAGAVEALEIPDPPTPFVAQGLSGHWLTRRDSELARKFAEPLASWSLTDKGVAAVESYDHSMNPGRNCIENGAPRLMMRSNVKSIEIGDEVAMIRSEEGWRRIIYMNVDSHDSAPYTELGHSIGRWEAGVLVVDTARFNEHRNGHGTGLTAGRQKHLVERFALNADGTSMTYTFVVEDPEYLAEPITGSLEHSYRPDLAVESSVPPCDPEIARRYLEE